MKILPQLLVCLFLAGCETDQDKYLKENEQHLLKISASKTQIEADGVSTLNVTAIIPDYSISKGILFTTSHGKFADSAKQATLDAALKEDTMRVTAVLVSSLEVTPEVKVAASIKGLEKQVLVAFTQAFPEAVNLESAIASIPANFGSEAPLQAFLLRQQGTPSLHQIVTFNAIKENGGQLGEFRAIDPGGSNDKGIVNAIFVLKDTTYTGPLRIIATAYARSGVVTDTLKIFITKKQ
ncbi:hypothetical protein AAHN97_12405 [Chitinophaga niabensis]|uniref:hypothetical protein n=1 Tax=Chitinophaga niabensis TaxID=536979 RepID=UPI0031B9B12C